MRSWHRGGIARPSVAVGAGTSASPYPGGAQDETRRLDLMSCDDESFRTLGEPSVDRVE